MKMPANAEGFVLEIPDSEVGRIADFVRLASDTLRSVSDHEIYQWTEILPDGTTEGCDSQCGIFGFEAALAAVKLEFPGADRFI